MSAAMPSPQQTLRSGEIAFVLSCAMIVYLYLFGAATLEPTRYAWMLQGDPAQHYLGWQFFRSDPWQWPPGRISDYGLPAGTAIAFTDSIPLAALLLKPFSGLLPVEFQYFGLWMLLCYLLCGYFSLRLLAHCTDHSLPRVLGAVLFLLSPPLLLRGYGHEALMAHWLLLAAMDNFLGAWRWCRWLLIVTLAALIHPYLLLMVAGVMVAHAATCIWLDRSLGIAPIAIHLGVTGVSALGLLWLAGYFSASGPLAAEGYGFFSMNLLSFIDPLLHWSRFMQPMPVGTEGQYEGFLYLGFGMILLGVLSLGIQLRSPAVFDRRYLPLAGIAALSWILALSNVVMLGNIKVFTLPLPEILHQALSIFRASGRFGWIAYYLIVFAILLPILRHLPARRATLVLLAGVLLQLTDQGTKYREFRHFIKNRMAWQTPLQSPLWDDFAQSATSLLIMPPHPKMELIYVPFAHLAAHHQLATNAAHLARAGQDGMDLLATQTLRDLVNGGYNPRILYVFPQAEGLDSLPGTLQKHVVTLDGYRVLPPGLAIH